MWLPVAEQERDARFWSGEGTKEPQLAIRPGCVSPALCRQDVRLSLLLCRPAAAREGS